MMWTSLYQLYHPIISIFAATTFTNSSAAGIQVEPTVAAFPAVLNTTVSEFLTVESTASTRPIFLRVCGGFFYSILSIVGMSGNSLVIFSVLTDPAVQSKTQLSNLAVLNLAYTDFLTTSVVCIPAAFFYAFDEYRPNKYFCFVWSVINLTGIVCTIGLLMVISIDRVIAVGWSLHYPTYMTYNRLLGMISYVWITSVICSLCWAFFNYEYDYWSGVCDFSWHTYGPARPATYYYGIFCTIWFCFTPSGIILFSNLAIIRMSKEKKIVGKLKDDSASKDEPKANAKILKAMVIVIVSYFVLTFPVGMYRVVRVVSGPEGIAKYIPGWATLVLTLLQFSASIINPLIYGLLRKDFRQSYGRIVKKMLHKS